MRAPWLILLFFIFHASGARDFYIFGSESGTTKPYRHENAFVTFMVPTETKSLKMYTGCVIIFLKSLLQYEQTYDIVVMYTPDVNEEDVSIVKNIGKNIKMVRVEKFENSYIENRSYKPMITKFHIWNMTQYKQIAYYDSDHIFLQNPVGIFADCGSSDFCATQDTHIGGDYFNAGLLVIRPNVETCLSLTNNMHKANKRTFAEQDMLNDVYKKKWKKIDSKYNFMHASKENLSNSKIVCIHEKWWVLQKMGLNQDTWIWNQIIKNTHFSSSFDFAFIRTM